MTKRAGLGRGIGALIPTAPTETPAEHPTDDAQAAHDAAAKALGGRTTREPRRPVDVFFPDESSSLDAGDDAHLIAVPGARLLSLDVDDIRPNHVQPRTEFDEDDLAELEHSIREFGVLQPIVVRPITGATTAPHFELVMGERRWRASRRAGTGTIPAVVKDTADDAMLRDALLENLHRAQLNPLEEASAYQQLMADFAITQDELSKRIGRSRPQISNTIRLLKLPEGIQARVASGVLSAGHARAILSLDSVDQMDKLADKIINEDLSVRAAEAAAGMATVRAPRKAPAKGRVQHGLDEIAERLEDRLDTRVKISLGKTVGQLVISFATVADLNRILTELGEDPFGEQRSD